MLDIPEKLDILRSRGRVAGGCELSVRVMGVVTSEDVVVSSIFTAKAGGRCWKVVIV